MEEYKVPAVGYVKLGLSDFAFILLGVGLVALGGWSAVTAPSLFTAAIAVVQALSGVVVCGITLHMGRRRIQHEEWVNPVRMLEAMRNHMLFEGS